MCILWSFERAVEWRLRQKTRITENLLGFMQGEIDHWNNIFVIKTGVENEILKESKRLHKVFIDLRHMIKEDITIDKGRWRITYEL
jgi:hypothetical protein